MHNTGRRQYVANLFSKSNTNSDKACFGPAPGGRKITIRRTRSQRGNAPYRYDLDTGVTVNSSRSAMLLEGAVAAGDDDLARAKLCSVMKGSSRLASVGQT